MIGADAPMSAFPGVGRFTGWIPSGSHSARSGLPSPLVSGDDVQVRELPTGTVTFLFTDIEGSTRLLKRLGARYGELLAGHGRILRTVPQDHAVAESDTQANTFP